MGSTGSTLVRRGWRPAAAAALVALAGCGPGRGDVSGKVTYQGKTVVWGTVQFEVGDGGLKQGTIGSDGTYSVEGVLAGEAKVAVSSINPKSSDFQVIQRDGMPPPPPRPEVKGWFPIPEKYNMPHKSGLTYPVKPGANTIDINLE